MRISPGVRAVNLQEGGRSLGRGVGKAGRVGMGKGATSKEWAGPGRGGRGVRPGVLDLFQGCRGDAQGLHAEESSDGVDGAEARRKLLVGVGF